MLLALLLVMPACKEEEEPFTFRGKWKCTKYEANHVLYEKGTAHPEHVELDKIWNFKEDGKLIRGEEETSWKVLDEQNQQIRIGLIDYEVYVAEKERITLGIIHAGKAEQTWTLLPIPED